MNIKDLYNLFLNNPFITTDSRRCIKKSIFFALKGENFDGNFYAKVALDDGCSYAVIDNEEVAIEGDNRYILVDDVLKTLQELAREHRQQIGIHNVIAITGTNGKTTTKELLTAVLSKKYKVLSTIGNLNNQIGVPLTLLRLTQDDEIAIIEMGASHLGDIRELAEIAEPDYGIITNVGKAHLQGFISFEGVVKTKSELYDYIKKTSNQGQNKEKKIFIDGNNEYLKPKAEGISQVRYCTRGDAEVCPYTAKVISCNPYLNVILNIEGRSREVRTQLIGEYNISNMLAAATIGAYFKVDFVDIVEALEEYKPQNNRSQLTMTSSNKLILDTYNANPTSMRVALDNFESMQVEKKMVILGDMRELGETSTIEHQKVIDRLSELHIERVWLVGEEFGRCNTSYPCFVSVEEVKQEVEKQQIKDYYILIKGSNGIKLWELENVL